MGVAQAQKSWCSGNINQRKGVSLRLRVLCRNNFVFQQKTESSICVFYCILSKLVRFKLHPLSLSYFSTLYMWLIVCVCVCVCVCVSYFSHVWLIATLWTIACQAPLSMGFPRQEYGSRPFPPPGDVSSSGTEPCLLHWQVDSLPLSHLGSTF